MVSGISNIIGFCGSLTRGVVAAGRTTITHLGSALAAIGTVGSMWISERADMDREQAVQLAIPLITPDMSGREISDLIKAVDAVPRTDRKQVTQIASLLITPDMSGQERCEYIKAVAANSRTNREAIRLAIPLFTQWMNSAQKWDLIEVVAQVPQDDRAQVVRLATPLMPQDMDVRSRCEIIRRVTAIVPDHREQVIGLASRLKSQVPVATITALISIVSNISSVHREQFVDDALFLTLDLPLEDTDKVIIWHKLSIIDPVERAERAQRASDQINQDLINGVSNYNTLDHILYNTLDRILTILETPLDQPIPPRATLAARNIEVD